LRKVSRRRLEHNNNNVEKVLLDPAVRIGRTRFMCSLLEGIELQQLDWQGRNDRSCTPPISPPHTTKCGARAYLLLCNPRYPKSYFGPMCPRRGSPTASTFFVSTNSASEAARMPADRCRWMRTGGSIRSSVKGLHLWHTPNDAPCWLAPR
ncbi:hypothetical protein B0H12DRAFT_1298042, partial [Mycena haematopus]